MDEDAVLLELSKHTQAVMAQTRASDALLKAENDKAAEYTRLRLSQERHTAILNLLTEQAGALLGMLPEVIQAIAAIREWQIDASERLESLERGVILWLSGRGDNDLLEAIKHNERISSLRRQLTQETQTLNLLEEHRADVGFDVATENKIRRVMGRIEEIKNELQNYA